VAQEGVLVDTAMNILVPLHARNFWVAGQLVGSQDGHGSME
jgi:hypothetical protein